MQAKKIVIAADHAGCPLKQTLIRYLENQGHTVINYGTDSEAVSVDYPDEAYLLAKGLYTEKADCGILVCGSGIGMSIAVNRYDFVRAALVCTSQMAELSRRHNNANVLVLGGRLTDEKTALDCLDTFLTTPFEGERHEKRVQKLGRMPHDFE